MKKVLLLLSITVLVGLSIATTASASHGGLSCAGWASRDGYHPNAPGSYSSYNCSDGSEYDTSPGDYARVNGRGWSGTLHHVRIHAVHFNCFLWICDTRFDVYEHWHG